MIAKVSRRDFLKLAGTASLLGLMAKGNQRVRSLPLGAPSWVTTGYEFPELAAFDTTMRDFMQARNISGGSLAVTRNSKLVLARGYTYSDDDEDIVVEPTSLFRIASISKPVTATAVLRLVQDGQLNLSEKLTELLPLTPPSGQTPDSRLTDITVLNLLQHLGGWDRNIVFDPMFHDFTISSALGKSLPISKTDIATFMTGQPLQHDPSTTYAYSNYGYSLLGQVIEAVTNQPYQNYVKQNIFNPINVSNTTLGRTLSEYRLPNEVKYHTQYNGITVFDDSSSYVPWPYGGWNLENMDSHGGWLSSAVDLVRLASTLDSPASSPVLNSASTDIMFGLPEHIPPASYTPGDWYYGCGWAIRDWGNGIRNTWHDGSLDGTYTLLVRRWDGLNWCVLFNQRDDSSGISYSAIDGLLHTAGDSISSWPDHDLFDELLFDETVFLPTVIK